MLLGARPTPFTPPSLTGTDWRKHAHPAHRAVRLVSPAGKTVCEADTKKSVAPAEPKKKQQNPGPKPKHKQRAKQRQQVAAQRAVRESLPPPPLGSTAFTQFCCQFLEANPEHVKRLALLEVSGSERLQPRNARQLLEPDNLLRRASTRSSPMLLCSASGWRSLQRSHSESR